MCVCVCVYVCVCMCVIWLCVFYATSTVNFNYLLQSYTSIVYFNPRIQSYSSVAYFNRSLQRSSSVFYVKLLLQLSTSYTTSAVYFHRLSPTSIANSYLFVVLFHLSAFGGQLSHITDNIYCFLRYRRNQLHRTCQAATVVPFTFFASDVYI